MSKKEPYMVAFVGSSGSGKTATIEYVTQQLTRLGFKVGVAKHIHEEGFTIDTEGKDTWRHAHAGARVVIGASPNELAVIMKTPSEAKFQEITRTLRTQDIDIALLEGFSGASDGITNLPKVITAVDANDLKATLRRTTPPILAITGRIARVENSGGKMPAPLIDMQKEGFLLTSMIRQRLRPGEMKEMLSRASKKHGGTCIGLAIGIRAAYITSSVFQQEGSMPKSITCGTKHCIAEAFRTIYPKTPVRMEEVRNDRVLIESRAAKLALQLAPKEKNNFSRIAQVLAVPDKVLFESISLGPV